jgi:hypothetical protein
MVSVGGHEFFSLGEVADLFQAILVGGDGVSVFLGDPELVLQLFRPFPRRGIPAGDDVLGLGERAQGDAAGLGDSRTVHQLRHLLGAVLRGGGVEASGHQVGDSFADGCLALQLADELGVPVDLGAQDRGLGGVFGGGLFQLCEPVGLILFHPRDEFGALLLQREQLGDRGEVTGFVAVLVAAFDTARQLGGR